MANLFDRLKETFTLQVSDKCKDASYELKKEKTTKTDVTQENEETPEARQGLVSAYTVNKQDGGKTSEVKASSSENMDNAAKMKADSQFVIPKRKRDDSDILVDLMINSREFQYEILPAILKSYRTPHSAEKFKYTKVQSVHNRDLLKLYLEKRKELRNSGYSDKEAGDCVAFLCVEDEELLYKICRDGVSIGNYPRSCLGHPMMGVQLCKHADIIKPMPLQPNETGYLVLFKIIKGRIKSVAESMSDNPLEPTPHFDCHVTSNTLDNAASPQSLFETSQVYMYEYGEEGVLQCPRNVCPVAVVSFVYEKDSRDSKSCSPRVHPSLYRGGSVMGGPAREGDQEFVVWSGSLTIKGLYACNVEMTSSAAFVKPAVLGSQINISSKLSVKQVQQKYLRNVCGIRRSSEGFWNGHYVNACELRPVTAEGRSHFKRVMNYLGKHNAVAVQKLKKDVTLLIITQSELTYQLGLSRPHQYPVLLYCLFLSRTSARKRLSHTTGFGKETEKLKISPAKRPQSTMSSSAPPLIPGSDDLTRSSQSFSSPFLPPSSPHHSISPYPKRDYQRSPSSNIVSWPQNAQFGSPRNLPVPHSTPPLSPAAHGGAPVPHTPPYRMPQSPHSGPHSPFHGPDFGTSPRRLSRDGQHGFPYPPESKSGTSFNPPNTFPAGPNFDPHYQPRPNFSPRSPYKHPSHTGDQRFQNPPPHFGNNSGYGGPRFPEKWNSMQSPAFPERFDPNRSPRMLGSSFENSGPSDSKFNTLPHFKMHNMSNDPFNSPTKPAWPQGSPYRGSPSSRANFNLNVQTTLHRSDPRLSKNVSPKVNPVAPMPRGSTSDTHGSPSQGMVSPVAVEFSSSKMSPVSLPSPQQVPVVTHPGTPPQHQSHPVPPSQAVSLPEPPKPSRVSAASILYDSGFFFKPPSSSLMQYDKVKKVFEEQNVVLEIQQRAKEAIKRHLLARSRSESKKTQSSEAEKLGDKQIGKNTEKEVVESAEDMKQLLESNLESKISAKKRFDTIKKKDRLKHELKEKQRIKEKEKHSVEKHKVKVHVKQHDIKQKDDTPESLLTLKIPKPEAFKLDSLEDIARMRKITEEEIKKESERQHMDDLELEEDVVEEVTKKSKKRPKERDSVDEKEDQTDSDEVLSKKAKIDTASDMKDFLNCSLEENNSSSELTPLRTELIPKRKLEKKKRSEGKSKGDKQSKTEFYNICDEIQLGGVVRENPKTDNVSNEEKSSKTATLPKISLNAECDSDKTIDGSKVEGKGIDKKMCDQAKGSQPQKSTPTTDATPKDKGATPKDKDATPKDKKSLHSESEKMETEVSDQSGRWDNPMKKKKRQDSESDGERKIENQKGKIIIIKEIRMIRVNSDGSEIKSPEKEPESKGLSLESPASPVQVPLEEIPETVEIKLEEQEERSKRELQKKEKESSKRKEKEGRKEENVYSKRKDRVESKEDDVKKKSRDECREKPKRKDESKVKEKTSESKGKGKSEDCRKHLVYYSDTESESSRSQSSSRRSRRSDTPKSDDDVDSVPRYTRIYPDFKPGRNAAMLPKAASTSSRSRTEQERKPGDQRRSLHHKTKHKRDSKTFSHKSGKAGISKLTGDQVKTKVRSLIQSRKQFKAQQAIIEGIITSCKIPMKKIPKIQKQMTNSTSVPRHKSLSLHSSGESKEGFPEKLQPKKPSPHRERVEQGSNDTQTTKHSTESPGHPMDSTESPEHPVNSTESLEHPVDSTESLDHPVDSSESREHPVDRIESLERPVDNTDYLKHTVDRRESLEHPMVSMESLKLPVNSIEPLEHPTDIMESLEHPIDRTKSLVHLVDKMVSLEHPVNNMESVEKLVDGTESFEHTVDSLESKESPADTTESWEHPMDSTEFLEHPFDSMESLEHPMDSLESMDHPMDSFESLELPVDSYDSIELSMDSTKSMEHPLDTNGEELIERAEPFNGKMEKPSHKQVCESAQIKNVQNQQEKVDDLSKAEPDIPQKASSFEGRATVLSEIPKDNLLANHGKKSELSSSVIDVDPKTAAAGGNSSSDKSTKTIDEVLLSSVKNEKETVIESPKHVEEKDSKQPLPVEKKKDFIKTLDMLSKKTTVQKMSSKINDELHNVISSFISKQKRNARVKLDKQDPNYVKEKQNISVFNSLQPETWKNQINDEANPKKPGSDQHAVTMGDFIDLENYRDLPQVEETPASVDVENDSPNKTHSLSTTVENDVSSPTDSSMEIHSLEMEKNDGAQESGNSDSLEDENSSSATPPKVHSAKLTEEDFHPKQKEKNESNSSQLAVLRRCYNSFCHSVRPGKVTGLWNGNLQTGIQDEWEPVPDRMVQAQTDQPDLKMTITNDMPVSSKFSWISKEQLIRDCIHGKFKDPLSVTDVSLVVAVNHVIHKIPPHMVHQRSVAVNQPSEDSDSADHGNDSADHGNENGEDSSPDYCMDDLEVESFKLEKSPNCISDFEVNSPLKQMQDMKDSKTVKLVLPDVGRLMNLVKVQLEDSNDETSISSLSSSQNSFKSLSSSQNSFKSLSSSQNSHDMFEKALSEQLNSISQGLDLLIQSNSEPLSFITPAEGKEINNIIDVTMKSLQASMHKQSTDSGKKDNTESEAAAESSGSQEEQVTVKKMPNSDSDIKIEFTASQGQPTCYGDFATKTTASETVADCKTDETAFWSKILGFSAKEEKTLPLFINTSKEKDDTGRSKTSTNNEYHENGSIMEDNFEVNEVIGRLEPEDCELDSEGEGSEQVLETSVSKQVLETSVSEQVVETLVSEQVLETFVSEQVLETSVSEQVVETLVSEQDGAGSGEPSASVNTHENAMEMDQGRKAFISPIRFPEPAGFVFGQIKKENIESESGLAGRVNGILDDNNNTEVSSIAEKRTKIKQEDATTEGPVIKVEPTDEESNGELNTVKQWTTNVEKEKTQPLNLTVTKIESHVNGKMMSSCASNPEKIISQQEKTLAVLMPETKQKVTSQRLSPALLAMTDNKGSGNSPRDSPRVEKEENIETRTIESSPTKGRQGNVFSRLAPQVAEDVKVKVEKEVSPDRDIRIVQLDDPIQETRNDPSVSVETAGGKKQTEHDEVVITISNERPRSNKSMSRSPNVQAYRPPQSSANAEPLSQVGPIRNKQKTKREERQYHPYKKEKKPRSNSWSFDISYHSLKELMHDLTVCSYRSQQRKKKHWRTNSRFADYNFVRSKVPEALPGGISNTEGEEEEIDEEFNENAIPDFEERKRKADLVDELTLAEQENEDYAAEREVYVSEELEQPKEGDSVKTEEPVESAIPRMLAGLPVRTPSSPQVFGHKFNPEEMKIKTDPESTVEKSSETRVNAVKLEDSMEIKKEEQTEKASSVECGDVDAEVKMEFDGPIGTENTEQVSSKDELSELPVNSAMPRTDTDAMKMESSEQGNKRVEFLNSSSGSPVGDGETEIEGFSDWIVIDEAPEESGVVSSLQDITDYNKECAVNTQGSASHSGLRSQSADNTQVKASHSGLDSNVDQESVVSDSSNLEFNSNQSVNDNAEAEKDNNVSPCDSGNCEDTEIEENILSDSMVLLDEACEKQSVKTILDKTLLEVQDMSLSEEDGISYHRKGTDHFIPVVHLMGVKGNTFWYKQESNEGSEMVSEKDVYPELEENVNSESGKTVDMGDHSLTHECKKSDDSEKSKEETEICRANHSAEKENEISSGGPENHCGDSLSEGKELLQMAEEDKEHEPLPSDMETLSVNVNTEKDGASCPVMSTETEEKDVDSLPSAHMSSETEEKDVDSLLPSALTSTETERQSNSGSGGRQISFYNVHGIDDLEKKHDIDSEVKVMTDLVKDVSDSKDNSHPCNDRDNADDEEERHTSDDPDSEIKSVEVNGNASEKRDPNSSSLSEDQDMILSEAEGAVSIAEQTSEFVPVIPQTGVTGSTICEDGECIPKFDEEEALLEKGGDENVGGVISGIDSAVCADKRRGDLCSSIQETEDFPDDMHEQDENTKTKNSDKCKEVPHGEENTVESSLQLRAGSGGIRSKSENHGNPAFQTETSDSNPAAYSKAGVTDLLHACISMTTEAEADVVEIVMNSSKDVKVDVVSESSIENGDGLSLLIGAYENSEGESFNSSTEQNASHDDAKHFSDYFNLVGNDGDEETVKLRNPQKNSLKDDAQLSAINQSDTSHSTLSEINTEAIDIRKDHVDHKSDAVFADDKRKEIYNIENPREADGSFDTEQRLEDIMSVIGESDLLEAYPGMKVDRSNHIMLKIPDECDLCDDQLCLAKVKCLTDPLDPLEEAMLSSGILDVNDIPMGNVIEIGSDENCFASTDLMQGDGSKMSRENEEPEDCLPGTRPRSLVEDTGKYQRKCSDATEITACKKATNNLKCNPQAGNLVECKGSVGSFTFNPEAEYGVSSEVEKVPDYGASSGDDSGHSSSTETDYISDSLDSENEASTRGDDMTKLIVSEYQQSNQIGGVIDTKSRIHQTTEEVEDETLLGSHSDQNRDMTDNGKQHASQTIENLESKQKLVSLKEINQSVVKPLVAENIDYPFIQTGNSPPAMYSVPPFSQQMQSGIVVRNPQCTIIPTRQVPLNSIPQMYTQTQFQPFSNSTYSTLPLLLPYLHFPVVPQINPLLPLQPLPAMSSSHHTFELTNDKFEAFRRMNHSVRPPFHYPSPRLMPGFRNFNIPYLPICSSALQTPRVSLDYVERNLTPEKPGKKMEHLRTSPNFLGSNQQSPLLPPISSFRQRRIPEANSGDNSFSSHNTSPRTKNVAESPLDQQQTRLNHQYSTLNTTVSTHNLPRDALQKSRTPTVSVSPLDMTVQSKCKTGLKNRDTTKYKEGHRENFEGKNLTLKRQMKSGYNQSESVVQGHDLTPQHSVARRDRSVARSDRCSSGKIPVGHVKPMSFIDLSHKDNQTH